MTQCLGAMPLNSRCRKIAFDPWISLDPLGAFKRQISVDRELTLLVLGMLVEFCGCGNYDVKLCIVSSVNHILGGSLFDELCTEK